MGFAALLMSVILTFIIIILAMDPFSFGVYEPDVFLTDDEKLEVRRLDSLRKDSIRIDLINQEAIRLVQWIKDSIVLDSVRQDSLRRVKLVQSVYIYDKLNYTLATISVKREELLLRDSIQKIWKVADNYKTSGDSVSSLVKSGTKTADSLEKIVLNLNKKVEQSQEIISALQNVPNESVSEEFLYTEEQVTGYSKAYETMDPGTAAKHLEIMHEDDALEILIKLQPRAAGRILDKMEPRKAAKIWLNLSSKKQR